MEIEKLIVISAPSGAGKTTIVHKVLEKMDDLMFSISATTRNKRSGEKDGVDYYFYTINEFIDKISKEEFIEYQEVYTNKFYGTIKYEIERINNLGKIAILDLDVIGGINVKNHFNNKVLTIFIQPPSLEIIHKRLIERNTDSYEDIKIRISKIEKELEYKNYFDSVVINDNLEIAITQTIALIQDFIKK